MEESSIDTFDCNQEEPQCKRVKSPSSNGDAAGAGCHLESEKQKKVFVEEAAQIVPVETGLKHLGDIKFKSILNNSIECKRVTVEASYNGEPAVIILDKKSFTEEGLRNSLFSEASELNFLFQNDIYGSYNCFPEKQSSEIKATVIAPATQKHIEKYKFYPFYLVEETKEIYAKVTVPYLEGSHFSLNWVYNVLEHKKEAERIVFEDPDPKIGFILAPDLKWDGKTIEDLYLTAIVHARDIKSIRHLTEKHLPLLENILENGTKAIVQRYMVKRSQLRVYLHYQPSYYHLHVHFNVINNQVGGIFVEKAHLLTTVISNIKRDSRYYEETTLPFVVKESDPLFKNLLDYGYEF